MKSFAINAAPLVAADFDIFNLCATNAQEQPEEDEDALFTPPASPLRPNTNTPPRMPLIKNAPSSPSPSCKHSDLDTQAFKTRDQNVPSSLTSAHYSRDVYDRLKKTPPHGAQWAATRRQPVKIANATVTPTRNGKGKSKGKSKVSGAHHHSGIGNSMVEFITPNQKPKNSNARITEEAEAADLATASSSKRKTVATLSRGKKRVRGAEESEAGAPEPKRKIHQPEYLAPIPRPGLCPRPKFSVRLPQILRQVAAPVQLRQEVIDLTGDSDDEDGAVSNPSTSLLVQDVIPTPSTAVYHFGFYADGSDSRGKFNFQSPGV